MDAVASLVAMESATCLRQPLALLVRQRGRLRRRVHSHVRADPGSPLPEHQAGAVRLPHAPHSQQFHPLAAAQVAQRPPRPVKRGPDWSRTAPPRGPPFPRLLPCPRTAGAAIVGDERHDRAVRRNGRHELPRSTARSQGQRVRYARQRDTTPCTAPLRGSAFPTLHAPVVRIRSPRLLVGRKLRRRHVAAVPHVEHGAGRRPAVHGDDLRPSRSSCLCLPSGP